MINLLKVSLIVSVIAATTLNVSCGQSDQGESDTGAVPTKQEILTSTLNGTWVMTVDETQLVIMMHIHPSGKMVMDWTLDKIYWCREGIMDIDVIDIKSDRDFKVVPVWTVEKCRVPAGATATYHFVFETVEPLTYKVPDGLLADRSPFTGYAEKCSNTWDSESGCDYSPGLGKPVLK